GWYRALSRSPARNALRFASSVAHAVQLLRCPSTSKLLARSSSSSRYACSSMRASAQVILESSWRRGGEHPLQAFASARQSRHHRADRHFRDLGDRLVSHAFKFPHNDYFTKLLGQILERPPDCFAIPAALQQRFRIRRFSIRAVNLVVKFTLRSACLSPLEARVT